MTMQSSPCRKAQYGRDLTVWCFVLTAVISGIYAQQAAGEAQDAAALQASSGVLTGFVASGVCNGAVTFMSTPFVLVVLCYQRIQATDN